MKYAFQIILINPYKTLYKTAGNSEPISDQFEMIKIPHGLDKILTVSTVGFVRQCFAAASQSCIFHQSHADLQ